MSHHRLDNEALAKEFKAKAEAGAKQEAFKDDWEMMGIIKELQGLLGKPEPTASPSNEG